MYNFLVTSTIEKGKGGFQKYKQADVQCLSLAGMNKENILLNGCSNQEWPADSAGKLLKRQNPHKVVCMLESLSRQTPNCNQIF